ncbi:hypothetical protein M0R72_18335 [Candidatus Pacearchaeota archaeon]|jgi:hypothetical protein|nr:hypothetical protein [Candidatus Pacearchaeota archaeon]
MSYFDDLIRAGRDTDAMRLWARVGYENGKMGHTRMSLMVRVADNLEKAEAENAKLRAVVDAARVLSDIWSVGGKPNLSNLRYALTELDKEGER